MKRLGKPSVLQRLLIDACLDKGVRFFWQGPGTFLIERSGLDEVIEMVTAAGAKVLGFDGFEMSTDIYPQMDLIFDVDISPKSLDPLSAIAEWPADVWVDVVLSK